MTRANDGGLDGLLAQAQSLLTLFERVPAPPLGSLQELQLRLARAHAHGLVDQLVEIISSKEDGSLDDHASGSVLQPYTARCEPARTEREPRDGGSAPRLSGTLPRT